MDIKSFAEKLQTNQQPNAADVQHIIEILKSVPTFDLNGARGFPVNHNNISIDEPADGMNLSMGQDLQNGTGSNNQSRNDASEDEAVVAALNADSAPDTSRNLESPIHAAFQPIAENVIRIHFPTSYFSIQFL